MKRKVKQMLLHSPIHVDRHCRICNWVSEGVIWLIDWLWTGFIDTRDECYCSWDWKGSDRALEELWTDLGGLKQGINTQRSTAGGVLMTTSRNCRDCLQTKQEKEAENGNSKSNSQGKTIELIKEATFSRRSSQTRFEKQSKKRRNNIL